MHVSAGHFISEIGPTAASKVIRKVKAVFQKVRATDRDLDLDILDSDLQAALTNGGDGDVDDEIEGFDIGDTVGKALALVQQVRSLFLALVNFADAVWSKIRKSPQARAFFKQTCVEVNVPELELVQWVRTRWASLYAFLDRMLVLQKVC